MFLITLFHLAHIFFSLFFETECLELNNLLWLRCTISLCVLGIAFIPLMLWHCVYIPGFVLKFKHNVEAMLRQELCEWCCHTFKGRVIINWQRRRTDLYLIDKITISLILNIFQCLHVLVLESVIKLKLDLFTWTPWTSSPTMAFVLKTKYIALALNESSCIKKKKEVYLINLETDETYYEWNILQVLYKTLH